MKMKRKGITVYKNIAGNEWNEDTFKSIQYRTTDNFTKCAIAGVSKVLIEVDASKIDKNYLGVLVATSTGAYHSIQNIYSDYLQLGFRKINPSLFPNIMMSTVLSWCTRQSGAHGNSTTLLVSQKQEKEQIYEYLSMQLDSGRCNYMIAVYLNDQADGYCIWTEREETAIQRGDHIKIYF
ncbi:hypothetical protein [Lachnotalea glycerini]|nr:hypothetical protein [Lachnotalea glycerini]